MSNHFELQRVSIKSAGFKTEGGLRLIFPDGKQSTYGVLPHYQNNLKGLLTTAVNATGYLGAMAYAYVNEIAPKLYELAAHNHYLSDSVINTVLPMALALATMGFSNFGTARMIRVSPEKAKSFTVDESVPISEGQAKDIIGGGLKEKHAHSLMFNNCLHHTQRLFRNEKKSASQTTFVPSP